MLISVVLNSRSPYLLDRMLHSFEIKTKNYNLVQFIIGIDTDDTESNAYADQYRGLNVKFDRDSRTTNLNSRINRMVNMNPAQFYIILNDDVEMRTERWEETLLGADTRFLYNMDDGLSHSVEKMCCFPIMGAEMKTKLGFILPSETENPGADHLLYEIVSVRPDLIATIPIKVWHYKYGRHPHWFTRTLERPQCKYEINITKIRLDEYKDRIRNI